MTKITFKSEAVTCTVGGEIYDMPLHTRLDNIKTSIYACLVGDKHYFKVVRNSKLVRYIAHDDFDEALAAIIKSLGYLLGEAKLKEEKKKQQNIMVAMTGKAHNINVGDVFYSSWGWDQTNIDFYQVVELKGKCTVVVKRLKQNRNYEHSMAGTTIPLPNEFVSDETQNCRTTSDGKSFKVDKRFYTYPYKGRPVSFSSYA